MTRTILPAPKFQVKVILCQLLTRWLLSKSPSLAWPLQVPTARVSRSRPIGFSQTDSYWFNRNGKATTWFTKCEKAVTRLNKGGNAFTRFNRRGKTVIRFTEVEKGVKRFNEDGKFISRFDWGWRRWEDFEKKFYIGGAVTGFGLG